MAKKIVNLEGLVMVGEQATPAPPATHTLSPKPAAAAAKPKKAAEPKTRLRKAGFLVHPDSLRQFDVLRAELAGDDRRTAGPRLMHEALNLLFKKHGKPVVADLDV
jgi:hypothetical protein